MTNQEMLALLKGDAEKKQMLYDYFSNKITQGEVLSENEVPMFEALRKELTKKVVTMSGQASGASGAAV